MVLVLFGADLIAASKQFDEFGLKLGLGGHVHSLEMAVGIGADRIQGIYGTSWNVDIDTEGSRRFVEGIKQRTGQTANSRHYFGYLAAREALQAIERAGTTDADEWVKAMEGHRFDTLKQREGYWRAWDHQAIHDPLAIEAIPPGKWEFENQYFRTIAVGDAEKIALSKEENRAGPQRIQHERVVARAGYRPKQG